MLHYYKFRQDGFGPRPAREVYVKRGTGRGWPEECPPIRAANGFGFDLLANFDVTFVRSRSTDSGWRVDPDVVIDSDFDYAPAGMGGGNDRAKSSESSESSEDPEGRPLTQQYAWFWEKGQKLPHVITDNVYEQIRDQVKVSSFLFLKTDPNELLYVTEPPNLKRPFRSMTALLDTDWYPASYPWHTVIELDRREKKIFIAKGEPLCRVIPVRRDTYFAQEMTPAGFDEFFARGQKWLATHGQVQHEDAEGGSPRGTVDLTRTYVRQQVKSKFVVL